MTSPILLSPPNALRRKLLLGVPGRLALASRFSDTVVTVTVTL